MVRARGTTGEQFCSILFKDVVMGHRGKATDRETQTGASWQLEPCIGLDELLATDGDIRFHRGE